MQLSPIYVFLLQMSCHILSYKSGCFIYFFFGEIDFYCNHERGIFYFAESVGTPFAYPSCKCENWQRFTKDLCQCIGDDMSFMGEHCPRT